jgi:hypothetical protein
MRAAIYGPGREHERWYPVCAGWCAERGYELVSVVGETVAATEWVHLLRSMADGEIDIVVIATLTDLPADRMARVEIIGRGRPPRRPGLRALVYGPAEGGPGWRRQGMRWCEQAGYHIQGLVEETPDADHWRDVVRMMADGDVDLVVMASWGHLPPRRTPRVELVGVDPPGLLQPRASGWW